MDRVKQSREAWQRAHVDLQQALAELAHFIGRADSTAQEVLKARAAVVSRQALADNLLQRHITQLGKANGEQDR